MIHFILKENFILNKITERRKEGFEKRNGLLVKKFEHYTQEELSGFAKRYPTGFFRYVLYERGGESFYIDNSYAEIICSSFGEKLTPVKIIPKFKDIDAPNAIFVGNDLTMVRVFYKSQSTLFTITNYQINPKTGEFKEILIWKGVYENLKYNVPEYVSLFKPALDMAYKRLHDYRCTKVYFKA